MSKESVLGRGSGRGRGVSRLFALLLGLVCLHAPLAFAVQALPPTKAWRSVLRESLRDPDPGQGIAASQEFDEDWLVSLLDLTPGTDVASPIELAEYFSQLDANADGTAMQPHMREAAVQMIKLQDGNGVPENVTEGTSFEEHMQTAQDVPTGGGKDIYSQPLEQPHELTAAELEAEMEPFVEEKPAHAQEVPSRPVLPGLPLLSGGAPAVPRGEGEGEIDQPKTKPPTPTPTPHPPDIARRQHSCVLYEGERMMMFGGMDQWGRLRNDVWSYSITGDKWERMLVRKGAQPARRVRHSAVLRYNQMIVFGGNNGWRYLNDVWVYDMDILEWHKRDWAGYGPHRRERSAMVYGMNRVFILGGFGGWHFNDVWEFQLSTNRWFRRWSRYSPRPKGRASHGAAFEEFIYMFGGVDWWNIYNDLWRFDVHTNMWQLIATNGPSPQPRCMFSMVSRGRIYVMGGWGGRRELNDVWVWDLPTNEWRQIWVDQSFVRLPRLREHTAVLRGDDMIVHGGWGGVATSARTYAIDVVKSQAKSIGWVPRVIRILTKDNLEHMVGTYNVN